jgi:glycolate oxidase iron-sulfur subunit
LQTNFRPEHLADPHMKSSERILRSCVHCGFCTATCPTYVLLGDELDSPRGRIYLMKEMLESGKPATPEVVKHVDRCLSCLACMTTCPSGVHYMHLVDHGRAYIEATYRRPWHDRLMRTVVARVLPYRDRFHAALTLARLTRLLAPLLRNLPFVGKRLGAMFDLAPRATLPQAEVPSLRPTGDRKGRVALLSGCAQPVLAPHINAAAIRVLTRRGVEVVLPPGEGCCGALVHHMGREIEALAFARRNIDAWTAEIERGLDAIVITASGCGTTIKDYGFMFRDDPAYAAKAARVSRLTKDISEYLATQTIAPTRPTGQIVAYHSACSMQHGQQISIEPKVLLRQAGFTVKDVPEGHICCGSAGTYNLLQPELAARLRDRKIANIATTGAAIIATGNIGCITQIGSASGIPIVHTIELVDWAMGGPLPSGLAGREPPRALTHA